ncbi:homoserine dehydrogenase [Advenella mimigardefordensis]|uniref:Homoserine dehydrogenase n=1 Tax=Advenella mimigardefordensis (strain DSM 17166 / LMG 22922 / DPN7) TaxID=1247726 RepID=W0PET3_ADVMD|nr:homoserine dehydrogenase [Advenella mimigardefordensis]AHG63583.1 homoserine dehydrogenase [Advenella mimigardefordensis DPN7]
MNPMKVGLLGFGVVGSGTYAVLTRNAEEISRRAGRQIVVSKVATRTPAKAVAVFGDRVPVSNDLAGLVADPEVDIVVELIGGTTRARELVLAAIENGKHVVTANKALLALHGNEIFALASKKGVMVAFEAAVAGGIPIIKAIREGLTANRIQWLAGIINGTTNFILSQMREHGLPYETVLAQAQQLGYAEADPAGDVKGIDAAHKLTLMASLAFGIPIQFSKAHIEGIADLDQQDIVYAERLGYRIKLLGITRRREQGIELRVHPALVPNKRLIANVEGAMNAVVVNGDAVGDTLYYGPGAGSEATASAVVADLVDVTRLHTSDPGNRVPHLAFQPGALSDTPILDMEDVRTSYYLRLSVEDRSGVLADLTRILADHQISINSMMQEQDGENRAIIIFLTHEAREGDVNTAIKTIEAMPFVYSSITRIRLEHLD